LSPAAGKQMIDRKMSINEVLTKYPGAMKVFEDLGLACAGCEAALFENIEQGAQVHGVDIDRLLTSLKEMIGD
jgi:hybrid cluster-associated redox disulfide protein